MTRTLAQIHQVWTRLAQFGAVVAAIAGRFVRLPPPTLDGAPEDTALKHFAQFIGTVVLGMCLVFCIRWQKRKHANRWLMITGVVAALTVVAFFAERAVRSASTCEYSGQELTTGSRLTPDALRYRATLRGDPTCTNLLFHYAGDVGAIWQAADTRHAYRLLSVLMVSVWLGAALCIMSVAQAVRCATADQATATPARKSPARKRAAKRPGSHPSPPSA